MTDRCLDRLRDENSLMWPMMVSAMLRALSKALSCKDRGSDFMFLRTRVNSVRPRRNRSSASFWPIEPLSPNSLPIRSRVSAGTGVVSWTWPGVSFRATISWQLLKTRCSLKPKNQPIEVTYNIDSSGDKIVEQSGHGVDQALVSINNFTLPLNVENATVGTRSHPPERQL